MDLLTARVATGQQGHHWHFALFCTQPSDTPVHTPATGCAQLTAPGPGGCHSAPRGRTRSPLLPFALCLKLSRSEPWPKRPGPLLPASGPSGGPRLPPPWCGVHSSRCSPALGQARTLASPDTPELRPLCLRSPPSSPQPGAEEPTCLGRPAPTLGSSFPEGRLRRAPAPPVPGPGCPRSLCSPGGSKWNSDPLDSPPHLFRTVWLL